MSGMNLVQTAAGGVVMVDASSSSVAAVSLMLSWNVARGATSTVLVGTLPANARIISISVQVPVVSNAATTATVSVGLQSGSITAFTGAQDVKTAAGLFVQQATSAWAVVPAPQFITSTYTETGAASSAGIVTCSIHYCVN